MKIPLRYLASIPMALMLIGAWVAVFIFAMKAPYMSPVKLALYVISTCVVIWATFSVVYRLIGLWVIYKLQREFRQYFKARYPEVKQ